MRDTIQAWVAVLESCAVEITGCWASVPAYLSAFSKDFQNHFRRDLSIASAVAFVQLTWHERLVMLPAASQAWATDLIFSPGNGPKAKLAQRDVGSRSGHASAYDSKSIASHASTGMLPLFTASQAPCFYRSALAVTARCVLWFAVASYQGQSIGSPIATNISTVSCSCRCFYVDHCKPAGHSLNPCAVLLQRNLSPCRKTKA